MLHCPNVYAFFEVGLKNRAFINDNDNAVSNLRKMFRGFMNSEICDVIEQHERGSLYMTFEQLVDLLELLFSVYGYEAEKQIDF
jgi:NDP-sugar pyrophosphorylase family protein